MNKRKYKERSRRLTIARFQYYYEVTGLLPSEAIEEAGHEEDENIPLRRSKLVEHLDDFDDYLDLRYAHNTRQQSINTIRSFYRHNRISLPEAERLVSDDLPVNLTVQDLPGVDDVKKVLSIANVRDTAIIILQVSSGIGRAELIEITLQDLVDAVNRKNDVEISVNDLADIVQSRPEWVETARPLVWFIKRIKTSKHYFTFSSNESLDKILDYLDHRPPATWTGETKLFRTITHKSQISPSRLSDIYSYYNNECGFGVAKDGLSYFRSHNMRKLCGNLLKTRLGYSNADKILGHADRNRTRGDYLKPDIEELYHLYLTNLDIVTITKQVTIQTADSEEIEKIRAERDEDRKALAVERRKRLELEARYEEDRAEREQMKKDIERIKWIEKNPRKDPQK